MYLAATAIKVWLSSKGETMSKFSKTLQHDYIRYKFTGDDKTVLSGGWSRNGYSLKLEPSDPAVDRQTNDFFRNINVSVRAGKVDYGQVIEAMDEAAASAKHVDSFLDNLADVMSKKHDIDLRKSADITPSAHSTARTSKKGRKQEVDINFSNGEKLKLTYGGSSVGYVAVPDQPLFGDRLITQTFKWLAFAQGEELANILVNQAEASADIETWLSNVDVAMKPNLASALHRPGV